MSTQDDDPTTRSYGPDDDDAGSTIQGIWRTLLRLVPKSRRNDAWALANVLHHLLARESTAERRAAVDAAYQRGLEDGQRAGRLAAELENHKRECAARGVFIDDTDQTPPPSTQH